MKFRVGLLASISVSVVGFLTGNAVYAADLTPPPPPPPSQYVEVVDDQPTCFYMRADVGGSFHQDPTVTQQGGGAITNEKINNHAFIEAGTGCQVTENIRVEATAGYRFRSSMTEECGCLEADLETYTGFVNAFWDITYFNGTGFTPYVGGGVGLAVHRLTSVRLPAGSRDGNRAAFAYNATAGVSYDLSENVKMDLAYRFVDLGIARSKGSAPIKVDDLRAHEVKLGLRYQFGAW